MKKIAGDEQLHCTFAATLFGLLKFKPSKEVVLEIIKSALEAERHFICDSLPVDLIGMNSALMGQYVEFVADYLLDLLGYEKFYNSKNPFDWMTQISLSGKNNFFERRVGEYQKSKRNTTRPTTTSSTSTSKTSTKFVSDIDF